MIKYAHRAYVSVPRLLVVTCTTLAYISLLVIGMSDTFQGYPVKVFPFSTWLSFGLAELIGLLFLLAGTLVWLYARDRVVAVLLYCFLYAIAVAFALQTATLRHNMPAFKTISTIASIFAVLFLVLFTLIFPLNRLKCEKEQADAAKNRQRLLHSTAMYYLYIAFLMLFGLIIGAAIVVFTMQRQSFPLWFTTAEFLYYTIGLSSVLFFVISSYRRTASWHMRQQLRLFMYGTIVPVSPFLLLTVLPTALHLPPHYIVSGQYSAIPFCIFPFALSYAVLRYQLLHFEVYARRFVLWATGLISLALLAYIMVVVCQLLFPGRVSPYTAVLIFAMALLAPYIWGLSKEVTERVFFSEIAHYRHMIGRPTDLSEGSFDLDEVARLFTSAAVGVFETAQACLFVLDESAGSFRLYPPLREDAVDASRRDLVDTFMSALETPVTGHRSAWLSVHVPAIKTIEASSSPLLLREAVQTNGRERRLIGRYLSSSMPLAGEDILLAPMRAQGRVIGILVLGDRGEHLPYAGPDFEVAQLLVSRFASLVDNARWYLRANQHSALLNGLSKVGTPLSDTFKSISEVAEVYASVAAEATSARAEIWLYDEARHVLRCQVACGTGPGITKADTLRPGQKCDWSPVFNPVFSNRDDSPGSQQDVSALLACLPELPDCPFAWLPLLKNEQNIGVLVLTYAYPHSFMKEEARVLELFAKQCATALENARITLELRQAYERQQELDQLKDQFIATASHELRTPLTAVQGYIELLNEYNETLDAAMRSDFITKAKRSCEELSLLVDNIMDASHVYADAKNMFLHEISLHAAIKHVLDILEGIVVREEREVEVDISDDLMVYADSIRLRQVLLNLLSNALKYSPSGSSLHITATSGDCLVTVRVRDYGLGIPAAMQSQLFQRFVRMERDMNSPVRGAGLGLFISRQLIEAMGGQLWVESEGVPGRGSTFIFTLRCNGSCPPVKV